jgi:uncharacterized SAM-binding protein YcdF (DUF218 family)
MDTLFFFAAKLAGALISPDTWIVVALGAITVALRLDRRRIAETVCWVALAGLLALAIVPIGEPLLQPIEKTYPANPRLSRLDGIVVLGGGEDADGSAFWDQPQLNEAGERFTGTLALARRFPDARVVFTGGSGRIRDYFGSPISEATVAEAFFLGQGLDPDRLILESASRNTAENARLSLALAQPSPGETWVLVTSAFHMPRAMRSFEAAGWEDLVAYPVDYRTGRFADRVGWNLARNLIVLNTATKETVGSLAYRMTGR